MKPSLTAAVLATALTLAACSHSDRGAGESLKKLPSVKADASPDLKEIGDPDDDEPTAGEKLVAEAKPKKSSSSGYKVDGTLKNKTVTIAKAKPNTQVTLSRAKVSGSYIAITFDDGPARSNTTRLLDILKERNIPATFFVISGKATSNASLLRRMVSEGHEIGNHTISHPNLAKFSDAKVRRELDGCHKAIVDACGVAPTIFRPPYGAIKSSQKQWIFDEYGYTTVLWSVDPRDWQRPGVDVVARRLVEGARPGGVLLAHDIHEPTIDAMPQALDELLRRGFQFVTVSQLMALQEAGNMGPPQIIETAAGKSTAIDPISLGRTGPPAILRPGMKQGSLEVTSQKWVQPAVVPSSGI